MTNLDCTKALVIGAGRSGRAAVDLLIRQGARVRVIERSRAVEADPDWPASVAFEHGDGRPESLQGIGLVVPSPGVPRDHDLLRAAVARRIPVWSEIELAARFLPCPMLAVTGTNGKSTTTVLLGAMLSSDGYRVFVGGNLGTPLAEAVSGGEPYDAAVVEVSSFQLEWVDTLHPHIAVLLNLTPDHLDRYPDMAAYGAAKAALLVRQEKGDFAVLNRDDPWVWEQRNHTGATVLSFAPKRAESGSFLEADDAVVPGCGVTRRYSLCTSRLWGSHNRENILAAVTAASAWGVSSSAIRSALLTTGGLPHRLEFVHERRGARYYDDSKATNVGAVQKAIASFEERVVLLLGGYDKGGDFAALRPSLAERVAEVVCFGAAGPQIAAQLGAAARCRVVPGLADAVRTAAGVARPGQVVVLAPGCASFDEFGDYAERGRRYCAMVEAL